MREPAAMSLIKCDVASACASFKPLNSGETLFGLSAKKTFSHSSFCLKAHRCPFSIQKHFCNLLVFAFFACLLIKPSFNLHRCIKYLLVSSTSNARRLFIFICCVCITHISPYVSFAFLDPFRLNILHFSLKFCHNYVTCSAQTMFDCLLD